MKESFKDDDYTSNRELIYVKKYGDFIRNDKNMILYNKLSYIDYSKFEVVNRGYIVDVKQPYLSEYHRIHPELPQRLPLYITKYCSGRFYFLSSEAVQDILSKRECVEREFLEDYAIGFNLSPIFKQDILLIATNKYFTDIELSDFPRLVQENKI